MCILIINLINYFLFPAFQDLQSYGDGFTIDNNECTLPGGLPERHPGRLVTKGLSQVQPKKETWVSPLVGPLLTGGVIGVRCIVHCSQRQEPWPSDPWLLKLNM